MKWLTRLPAERRGMVLVAAALLLALAALALAWNVRSWRRLQVDFLALERREAAGRLAAAEAELDRAGELRAELAAERERLAERGGEVARLTEEIAGLAGKRRAAERRRSDLAARLARARERGEDAARTAALEAEVRSVRAEVEGLGELIADREEGLAQIHAGLTELEERWAAERAPVERWEQRRVATEQGAWIRRLPLVGLFHPSVGVRQIETAGPERVDRCVTCHLAAERDGDEAAAAESAAAAAAWPAPFRVHPRRDLFVAPGSPHPATRFGCSACHGGEGRAVDFSRAGHVPATVEQATAWQDRWGFDPARLPLRPIWPRPSTEAGCAGCHAGAAWIPGAETASAGRELVRRLGCGGCHAGELASDAPRPGPSLAGIAGKVTPGWAYRWIAAPRSFSPATAMPHLFPPAEELDDAGRQRQGVEIRALVAFLWDRSRSERYPPPPDGDAAAGAALFDAVGCAGCHRLANAGERGDHLFAGHGPDLASTGSKVSAGWLYAWLRDPRAYRPDTPMPDLRLSGEEAAHLTAFLASRRDPRWDRLALPPRAGEALAALTRAALEAEHTLEESQAWLAAMSEQEREVYLGERLFTRHGCHGCHDVAGVEPGPIAGPLAALPQVPVPAAAAVDFHQRPPAGAAGDPRPPMPDYALSAGDAQAIRVELLGRGAPAAVPALQPAPAPELLAGRELVARFGCRGCHRVEGSGGALAATATLPDLAIEGARVRSPWLFDYLRHPAGTTIRPWLAARMPTFHLSGSEADVLVRYFARLAGGPLLVADPPPPSPADLAVGAVVYDVLQCGRCHLGAEESEVLPIPQLAPSYHRTSERLRPTWVVRWILDPHRFDPQTSMPVSFPPGPDGRPDSSFLIGTLTAPMFAVEDDLLRRHFASEEELAAYLADPERVAAALRDYLWSLAPQTP